MEKRKLKKLKINRIRDEFPIIGNNEQLHLKGGDDPIYNGGMLPEVTVYGNGDAHWKKEGKHDVAGCVGCGYGIYRNTSQAKPEHDWTNYWIHRIFHRKAYY